MATLGNMMTPPTRQSSPDLINRANLQMRQQPWYQQWFQRQGLNPNQVHLSDAQRLDLAHEAARNGMPLGPDGMNIDPAGNINTPHGFASQPSWLKAVEIAAPLAVGGYFAAPAIGSALGIGAPTVTTGAAAGPLASTAPSLLAPVAAGVAPAAKGITTGFSLAKTLAGAAPAILGAGTQLYATHAATSANQQAAALEAQTAREALDYTKSRDAQQRQDTLDAQNKNFDLYQQGQARLAPYRQFGLGTLGQLMRPIPGSGSLGARMGA